LRQNGWLDQKIYHKFSDSNIFFLEALGRGLQFFAIFVYNDEELLGLFVGSQPIG
jgi:hypothetical protein